MSLAIQGLTTLLPVLHFAAVGLYGMEFAGPRAPHPRMLRRGAILSIVLTSGALLAAHWARSGHFPVAEAFVSIHFLVFCVVIIYAVVECATKSPTTGVFVFSGTFFFQLVASMFGPRSVVATSSITSSRFFVVHVTTIIASLAAILLSGFYGAMYLLLLRQMRAKRFGLLFHRLPPLEALSGMNRGAASAGFLLMTAGLNLGIWWAHDARVDGFRYTDPKILCIFGLWAVFGLIGLSRWVGVLSGRRAALLAVLGLGLVFLSFLLSLLAVGFHAFS